MAAGEKLGSETKSEYFRKAANNVGQRRISPSQLAPPRLADEDEVVGSSTQADLSFCPFLFDISEGRERKVIHLTEEEERGRVRGYSVVLWGQ